MLSHEPVWMQVAELSLSRQSRILDKRPFRAVKMSRSIGAPGVLSVRPDRFDRQVEFAAIVDVARITVRLVRRDGAFIEVAQAINALKVAALHRERRARSIPRPREFDQLAQL
jgi:hypothetical protein